MEEIRCSESRKLVDCDYSVVELGLAFDEGCRISLPNDLFDDDDDDDDEKVGKELDSGRVGKEIVDLGLFRNESGDSSDSDVEATMAVMTSLIEVFGLEIFGCGTGEDSEISFVWDSLRELEQEIDEAEDDEKDETVGTGFAFCWDVFSGETEELNVFGYEKYQNEGGSCDNAASASDPADALFYALGYLGVKDLLSVEKVCKSLKDAVQNDPLLWRNIHIGTNLNITDDDLIRLTNRAQGTLCSLSMVQCMKITNGGVKSVLENNLGLSKLSVSACFNVRVGILLQDLKVFNSVGVPGIKNLRIGRLPDATKEKFNELKLLLGSDVNKAPIKYNPRYHTPDQFHLSLDDERDIDLEICPRCQEVRDVFDCPAESCKVKAPSVQKCRGCTLCIDRCMQCGSCLYGKRYFETFGICSLCFDCMGLPPDGHENVAFYGVLCRL